MEVIVWPGSLSFECPHICCWNCHVIFLSVKCNLNVLCYGYVVWLNCDFYQIVSIFYHYFDTTVSSKRFSKTNALGNSPQKRHDYKRKIVVYYWNKLLGKSRLLRRRPHCAARIYKQNLFLRLRGFRPQNAQTGRIWKRRLCVLKWTENILITKPFVNDDVAIIMIFSYPSFTQTKCKITGDCCVFKFLRMA